MLDGRKLARSRQFDRMPGAADRPREQGFDDHPFKSMRQGQMLDMLNRPLRNLAPDADAADASGASAGASAGAPPAQVLDQAALARLAELDPSGANRLLERVLQAFQTSVARLRPQLIAGRADGDPAAIRLVTHTLKSSSASIGALRLSQLCAEIETAIRLEPGAELGPQLDALDVALDATVRAITEKLEDRG
jgi:HPt (histidine-containing phosphotransfer) domain-containing protein